MAHSSHILMLVPDPREADLLEIHLRKGRRTFAVQRVGRNEQFQKALQERLPDVIIVDSSTPRFALLESLGKARELTPGVPWVIIADVTGEEFAVQCMKAGAADFLHRRQISRLGAVVEEALVRRERAREESADAASPGEPGELPSAGEDSFRNILDRVEDLVATLDDHGGYVYVNSSYARIVGDTNALRGTSFLTDVHPDDRATVRNAILQVLEHRNVSSVACRLIDQEAATHAVEGRFSTIRGEGGHASTMLVFVGRGATRRSARKDVVPDAPRTDREPVAYSLYHADSRLRDSFDALADGILLTDSQDIIIYSNEGATSLFGFPPLSLVGKSAHVLLPVHELRRQAGTLHGSGPGFHGRRVTFQKSGRPDVKVTVNLLPFTDEHAEHRGLLYLIRRLP